MRGARIFASMKAKPKTRTAAAAPGAASKLTRGEQEALEAGAEAEHATGEKREALTRQAGRLAGKQTPR